jgi:predicted DNA-binding protein (MmcQ/YjbR family)
MHIEQLREICLSFKGVEETFPFDQDTLVFKVGGKMFALTSLANPVRVNIKCDPQLAIERREQFEAVQPGWHMSKIHWNTVSFNEDVPDNMLADWIRESYELVKQSLPKKLRASIE